MPRYSVKPTIAGSPKPVVIGNWDDNADVQADGTDQILLGRLNEAGARREVFMDVTSETVIALFGKRGAGKSFSLGVLAESLCTKNGVTSIGSNRHDRAALMIDTLNIFWTLAQPFRTEQDDAYFPEEISKLLQWKIDVPELEVEVWVPRGTLDDNSPRTYRELSISVSALATEEVQELTDLDPNTPSGQLMADVWEVARESNPMFGLEHVDTLLDSSDEFHFYNDSTIRAVKQRIRNLRLNPIFQAHGTNINELLSAGTLSVLEFGRLSNIQRSVLSAVLIRLIHRIRQEASDIEKHLSFDRQMSEPERDVSKTRLAELIPPCWILVDEAQTVFPSDRSTKATDAFVTFVKEGRNFGLSFALATQQPAAVDQRILSQVDTVICHTLTVESDISRMQSNLKSGLPSEVAVAGKKLPVSDWMRSLEPGHAIVSNSNYRRAVNVEMRPRVSPHAGSGFSFRPDSATEGHD